MMARGGEAEILEQLAGEFALGQGPAEVGEGYLMGGKGMLCLHVMSLGIVWLE